jgi:predicted Rossmann-fold nucleotide-binding protein
MTAVSQGAAEAGGHVIGVASSLIEQFRGSTVNAWVKEVIQYETLTDRLLHLVQNNQGMIVLPGGIGTLSEMALAWSLLQVGEIESRPMALLGATWRETVGLFSLPEYVPEEHLSLLRFVDTPEEAVAHVSAF